MEKNKHSKQWIRNNETFATEETLFKTLNFENSHINSIMNLTVKLDDSSSSYWRDQKQVQQNSENLESIIQKLFLRVKISVFSKVIPKWLSCVLSTYLYSGFELDSLDSPASSKEFLGIQATIECKFTLERIRDIIITYSYTKAFSRDSCKYYKW